MQLRKARFVDDAVNDEVTGSLTATSTAPVAEDAEDDDNRNNHCTRAAGSTRAGTDTGAAVAAPARALSCAHVITKSDNCGVMLPLKIVLMLAYIVHLATADTHMHTFICMHAALATSRQMTVLVHLTVNPTRKQAHKQARRHAYRFAFEYMHVH